jgi:predicted RNA binding protein YcfA (HicA-like mRNA interferase family)
MTKLPVVKGKECVRALQRGGFSIDRQKGSHITLIRDDPFARTTVPNHNKPLKPGTLRQIIKDAGLTVEEFTALL